MLTARFAADRSGTAPLTWGQRSMWNAIGKLAPVGQDQYMNVRRVLVVPPRLRLDPAAVAAALGQIIERHESLRTLIVDGDEPRQVVVATGELPVEVLHCTVEEAAALGEATRERLCVEPFAYATELPVRASLLVADGRADRVAVAFSHVAVDGPAADLVLRELRLLMLRGRLAERTAPQPLDLAEWQTGPLGRQRTAESLAYWTEHYRHMPPTMLAPAGPVHQPRHQRALLTSGVLHVASGAVAARYRTSSGTVLLAATTALVAARTGHPTVTLSMIVNNRFQSGHRDVISNLAMLGLLVVDVADKPAFDVLLARVHQAALRGYRNAYHDPTVIDAALDRVNQERGTTIHPNCCFNDARLAGDGGPVGAEPAPSTITWPGHPGELHCRFCMEVYSEPGAVLLRLTADTEYLPPDGIEQFLHDAERLILTAN